MNENNKIACELRLGQLKIIFSFSSPPAPEKLAARNNFFIIIKSELVGSSRKPKLKWLLTVTISCVDKMCEMEDNLLIRFLIKGEIYYLRY